MDSPMVAAPRCLDREPSPPTALAWPIAGSTAGPVPLAGLVLELDHVLYDASPWRRWLVQLLARIGLHTHYDAFFCAFERDHLPAVYVGQRDYWDAWRDFLLAAGLSRGRVEEVLAAGHGKARELGASIRPLPGVCGALAQLAGRGVRLALLSNAIDSADALEARLETLGLAGRFEVVLSSRDLGCVKPDPESYQAAIDALALPPAEIGFVGHDPLELAGAGLAGLTTFAIHGVAEPGADFTLTRFEQLLRLIAPAGRWQRAG
jgi:FMN phosphatase YigB (HAD superfamily)